MKSNELKFELEMELVMWALLVQTTKVQTERTRQRKVERGKLLKSNEQPSACTGCTRASRTRQVARTHLEAPTLDGATSMDQSRL